jgi:hypothetical protein
MVKMPVGNQDIISLNGTQGNMPGQFIGTDKRIEQNTAAIGFNEETGMAKIGELHLITG